MLRKVVQMSSTSVLGCHTTVKFLMLFVAQAGKKHINLSRGKFVVFFHKAIQRRGFVASGQDGPSLMHRRPCGGKEGERREKDQGVSETHFERR